MAHKTNSFERFWKELKRRKVVHVITVYAATAFVILELVNMVAQPLKLPDWSEAFVIVLLCIGFVIAVLLSWVYDITPLGVKKTKPTSTIKHTDQTAHAVSGGWKIATYMSAVIIVVLVAFNFINRRNLNADISKLEKSIAVLPFINDSPSDSNQYFINGIMEEVLNNLQKISEFRVLSRTSTAQFQGLIRPTIPEIAKKLGVTYIVEGSGQKYGNKFVLRVQLIAGKKEKHLWAKSYDREIQQTTDIIGVHREIAQLIASELKATIEPEQKQVLERTPTLSLTAYDFYRRGKEEYLKYLSKNENREALEKAEAYYLQALKYDPAYALAYAGLAWVYWDKHFFHDYISVNFMDSVLVLCNIALDFDNQLAEAYTLKGTYYSETGKPEQAVEEFDKAIKSNPNEWIAYRGKGEFYFETDWVNYIKYFQKAVSINRGPELPDLLLKIGYAFFSAGFAEKAKQYYQDKLKLDDDSSAYYSELARLELRLGSLNKSLEFGLKSYTMDSTNAMTLVVLADIYTQHGRYEESLKYCKKFIERSKTQVGLWGIHTLHRIGFAFSKNENKKSADYYFNEQINYCERSIELGRRFEQTLIAYYNLAGVYAFRGERDKAYENLRIFNKKQMMSSWQASLIKTDPLFDSIRDEEEFQQIMKDVEAKYQAEHERVRKWLEEQGML